MRLKRSTGHIDRLFVAVCAKFSYKCRPELRRIVCYEVQIKSECMFELHELLQYFIWLIRKYYSVMFHRPPVRTIMILLNKTCIHWAVDPTVVCS